MFTGDWVDDKRLGKGELVQFDGTVYRGDWVNDKMHGTGRLESPGGGI